MRLADQLHQQAVDKFRHCYVRYDALLAQLQGEGDGAAPPPPAALLQRLQQACNGDGEGGGGGWAPGLAAGGSAFEAAFLQEVQRLRLFVRSALEQLWLALLDGCAQLRGLSEELLQAGAATAGRSQALGARLAAHRAALDATAQELVLLERFLRQNVAACAQLAQMHDQRWQPQPSRTGTAGGGGELPLEAVEGGYLAAAHGALLGGLALEPLVVGLSDGYEACRLIESDAAALAGRPAKWVPPDRFQRVTRKFWVHPADVMRFKAEVIKHLPVLLFGDRSKLTEGSPFGLRFLRDQAGLSDSSEVSSVYYDNPATLPSYHTRLRKEDMASVVRLRWYGERGAGGGQPVFVERKVHRDRYTGEVSYKERAAIAQRDVLGYTTGTSCPPEMAVGQHAEFLRDSQQFLLRNGQEPLVRTVYRRTAFQESSNNQVRISLDTQLHVVREAGAPRAPGDWDMGAPLADSDAVYFPYAVVEVKLQAEPPAWVEGLLATGLLLPVPKFSKFLHGTALLLQGRCANVPYWFLPDEANPERMTPATWEEMADPADEYMQKGALWLFPKRCAPFDEGGAAEAAAAEPAGAAVAPFLPTPLRFLRRNKTAPVPASSPTSSSEGPPSGELGAAAVGGGGAGGWANVQVAGGTPRSVSSPKAAALHPTAPAAAAWAPQAGSVQRNFTWPVYQNPLALLPPSEPSGASLGAPAAQQVMLPLRAPAAAAPTPQVTRPSPPASQTSTPLDSAQDLEAGRAADQAESGSAPKAGKGSSQQPSSGKGSGTSAGAADGRSSSFAALQYRLPGAPPPGGGDDAGAGAQKSRGRATAIVRTRVEPKTFFANERTFLQWLQISVLIMMTATSMLSGTGLLSGLTGGGAAASASCDSADKSCFASKLSGAIIAPVGLLFMGYALFMYRQRTYQILRRETARYDDPRGTVVLTLMLGAVFLMSYVMALVWIF